MITAYREPDRKKGHALMGKLIESVSHSVPGALAELITLGRTLKKRAADILAYFDRPGTSNGPTEAINGRRRCTRNCVIVAGTETTTCLIANLLYELLVERGRWERVRRDPGLITNAIEESLRHDTPLQFTMRTPQQTTAVAGCPVDHGKQVVLHLQSSNWDDQEWGPDAEEFALERSLVGAHLAFGKGIHACLGAPLARLETRVLLEELIDRFPTLPLAQGYRWVPTPELVMRRPARLDLVVNNGPQALSPSPS